jgi:hypothetical protein
LSEELEGHLVAGGKRYSYIRAGLRRREASGIITGRELFVVVVVVVVVAAAAAAAAAVVVVSEVA